MDCDSETATPTATPTPRTGKRRASANSLRCDPRPRHVLPLQLKLNFAPATDCDQIILDYVADVDNLEGLCVIRVIAPSERNATRNVVGTYLSVRHLTENIYHTNSSLYVTLFQFYNEHTGQFEPLTTLLKKQDGPGVVNPCFEKYPGPKQSHMFVRV